MNFKFCAFIFSILFSVGSMAQVPLFDDDTPNLGRQAKPKDKIYLTPDELPDVTVSLDNTQKQTPLPRSNKLAPKTQKQTRSDIAVEYRLSDEKSNEMSRQLNEEIQKYQAERAKAEAEKAQTKQPETKQPAKTEAPKMPTSLEKLFGQMHDVHLFDVSGIELGMTPDEVAEIATDNDYVITRVEHGIPLHRTSFYEHNCRNAGLHRVEVIKDCIIDQAKDDEVYYISSMTMAKPATAEYMQVLFSTHATDNVAYKIFYENKGDNSLNFTRRNLAKKVRRRDAFWNMMYETYGYPDDKELLIWGDPQKAYMQARMQGSNYNAYIVLEDKEIPDGDYQDADEQKGDLHYRHTFTFGTPSDED
ncbi:MAG: hypothetical protein IJV07_02325 [Alphaproteobacteria bacterium]|nr:hypothetical protein [Alphaproteobacteria bacterium]